MVEHLVCNQAVVGSNPVASTKASEAKSRSRQDPSGHQEGHPTREGTMNKHSALQSAFFDIQGKLENDVANYEYKRRMWLS